MAQKQWETRSKFEEVHHCKDKEFLNFTNTNLGVYNNKNCKQNIQNKTPESKINSIHEIGMINELNTPQKKHLR